MFISLNFARFSIKIKKKKLLHSPLSSKSSLANADRITESRKKTFEKKNSTWIYGSEET